MLSRLPEASAVTDTTVSTAGDEAVTAGPDVHVCAWERREGARASGGAVLGAAGGLTSLLDEIDRYGLQSWEVVSVVPSTYGGFPSHKSAKCHAPGTFNTGTAPEHIRSRAVPSNFPTTSRCHPWRRTRCAAVS